MQEEVDGVVTVFGVEGVGEGGGGVEAVEGGDWGKGVWGGRGGVCFGKSGLVGLGEGGEVGSGVGGEVGLWKYGVQVYVGFEEDWEVEGGIGVGLDGPHE